jgi:hypothetical protein
MCDRGFTIISEIEMGLDGLHTLVAAKFFTKQALPPVPDAAGPVKTRYRSKDIIHYRWRDDYLELHGISAARYARIGVGAGVRVVPWFHWLSLPGSAYTTRFIKCLLSVIPPEQRHSEGTFGLHCFRSFDNVVDGPHTDGFELGGTYVVGRTTGGAVSYLFNYTTGEQLLDHQLQPGEVLLFREHFTGANPVVTHGATALEPGGWRDAIVLQVDAPEDLEAAAAEKEDLGSIWQ